MCRYYKLVYILSQTTNAPYKYKTRTKTLMNCKVPRGIGNMPKLIRGGVRRLTSQREFKGSLISFSITSIRLFIGFLSGHLASNSLYNILKGVIHFTKVGYILSIVISHILPLFKYMDLQIKHTSLNTPEIYLI